MLFVAGGVCGIEELEDAGSVIWTNGDWVTALPH